MKTQVEQPLDDFTRNELITLLEDMPVNEFAVIEAKVTPNTVYNAVNAKRLKPKSLRGITKAVHRLRGSLVNSKVSA